MHSIYDKLLFSLRAASLSHYKLHANVLTWSHISVSVYMYDGFK